MLVRKDNKLKYYKIQHRSTGLFKVSGINGKFSRIGKLWLGSLVKNHLGLFRGWRYDTDGSILAGIKRFFKEIDPEDCDVVEYELVEVDRKPLIDFIKEDMKK